MPKTIDMRNYKQQVEIVVDYVYSEIKGLTDTYTLNKIDYELSYFVQGYIFMKAYKNGYWNPKKMKWDRWDGKNHLFKDKKFPTGLLYRIKKILKANNITYKINDLRKPVSFKNKIKTQNIEPREYQQRVLKACLDNTSGIIQSCTGSGKSIMITELIANTNVKTMLYVIGIDLLYQMKEIFENMLGTKVGIIGDGKADIRKINICTVWTAATALGNKYTPFDDEDRPKEKFDDNNKSKIVKAIKEAEMTIFDECQICR